MSVAVAEFSFFSMKSIRASIAAFVTLIIAFSACRSSAESTDITSSGNPHDQAEDIATLLIKGQSVSQVLSDLVAMSLREGSCASWASDTLVRIASGRSEYSNEVKIHERDWETLIDGFLISGFLVEVDPAIRNAYRILILQRDTKACLQFREQAKIEWPDDWQRKKPGQL